MMAGARLDVILPWLEPTVGVGALQQFVVLRPPEDSRVPHGCSCGRPLVRVSFLSLSLAVWDEKTSASSVAGGAGCGLPLTSSACKHNSITCQYRYPAQSRAVASHQK